MNNVFDPLNLLLLAIALVVAWRLRATLGQRTGLERPPFDPTVVLKNKTAEANDNVLEFPPAAKTDGQKTIDAEPVKPIWEGYAKADSTLAKGLEDIAMADGNFAPKSFLDGAKLAYEMVVGAFAKGDKATLKSLLSADVFDGFSKAIDARQKAGEKLEFQFVGFEKAEFDSVSLNGKRASITLKFVSELIQATYDKAGVLIDGEPGEPREITDLWTFERDVSQRDPNWRVVATETQA